MPPLHSFAEIIPQSLCTRYGLYFGAKMASFVHVLLWTVVRSVFSLIDIFVTLLFWAGFDCMARGQTPGSEHSFMPTLGFYPDMLCSLRLARITVSFIEGPN